MSVDPQNISSTMEDYLEAVLVLERRHGVARMKDISVHMQVKTPSATAAIKALVGQGLVCHESYGRVSLTREGQRLAEGVEKRHRVLYRFLTGVLRIAPPVAEREACGMEHGMSGETLDRLTRFLEKGGFG